MKTQTLPGPHSARRSAAALAPVIWIVAFSAGAQVLTENFDGVAAPALPAGWATAVSAGSDLWVTAATSVDISPNAAFIEAKTSPGNTWLQTPPVAITTDSAQFAFRHLYLYSQDPGTTPQFTSIGEGYLEISIDGGAFGEIQAAGGSFVTGGYPSGGAWVNSNFTYSSVLATLPATAAGKSVSIRWRLSTLLTPWPFIDNRWWVDSVQICDGPCTPLARAVVVDESGNGVWEPGETVTVAPSYLNNRDASVHPLGTAAGLDGPGGSSDYEIADGAADYGDIAPEAVGGCAGAGDCYSVKELSGIRQADHWDAQLSETLDSGRTTTWTLHVGGSFADTPTDNLFYSYVETVFHRGITGGCGGGSYCPGEPALRKQMAVFLLKAKYGVAYTPPPAAGIFTDVPASDSFAPWIEGLYNAGITGGCSSSPLMYCPDQAVLRKQMAVFLLKTLKGPAYVPPACVGIFGDVPCSSTFALWIEDLANRQIAAGCGNGNFCPDGPNTRGQMAAFLTKTFELTLYGP